MLPIQSEHVTGQRRWRDLKRNTGFKRQSSVGGGIFVLV
jgi:hypothetical protein